MGREAYLDAGDALLAQCDLSCQIVEAHGDYVWTLKANQPQMCEALATLFAGEKNVPGSSPETGTSFYPSYGWQVRHEVVDRVTSLTVREASAVRLLELVRGHWAIENRLHYIAPAVGAGVGAIKQCAKTGIMCEWEQRPRQWQ